VKEWQKLQPMELAKEFVMEQATNLGMAWGAWFQLDPKRLEVESCGA
jgi:hypothetical protein